MDKWFENPTKNKDFLEVIYTCLVLGYKGKYDLQPDCNEKIGYLCESIASAIAPLIASDEETMFKKAYVSSKKDSILNRFSFKNSKIFIAAAAILAIALSFVYALYSLDKQNLKNNISINNKIEIFMKDSNNSL